MSELSALWRHPEFRRGAHDMLGISLGLAAWGLVTGVAMVKGGLGVPLSLFMSMVVFSGSAQLASLPLIAAGAPIWVVWATAFCVNLRFVIFSAQWQPYFGHVARRHRLALGYFTADLNYVVFMRHFPRPQPEPGQLQYFLGAAARLAAEGPALRPAGGLDGGRRARGRDEPRPLDHDVAGCEAVCRGRRDHVLLLAARDPRHHRRRYGDDAGIAPWFGVVTPAR
jgi:hypothetical protein